MIFDSPRVREEIGNEAKLLCSYFSNLTKICNLSAIYIIPFRFMNYKEESISVDINTLKQLYAFFVFYCDINLLLPIIRSVPRRQITIYSEINMYAKVVYVVTCGKHFVRKTQALDS